MNIKTSKSYRAGKKIINSVTELSFDMKCIASVKESDVERLLEIDDSLSIVKEKLIGSDKELKKEEKEAEALKDKKDEDEETYTAKDLDEFNMTELKDLAKLIGREPTEYKSLRKKELIDYILKYS